MNEYVNQAMILIQKMIAAATPIAQKAYEIALLTLQIDALSMIVPLMVGVIVCAALLVPCNRAYKKAKAKADAKTERNFYGNFKHVGDYLPCEGVPMAFGVIGLICVQVAMAIQLLDVWLWVKLFKPELWLAHMAIEKLVK